MNNYHEQVEKYKLTTELKHRQQYGQFFTPEPVAQFMAQWVIQKHQDNILDPAFGLGIFAKVIFDKSPCKICGFELDKLVYERAITLFKSNLIELKNQDFLEDNWEHKYDRVISNPPYLKFNQYDYKTRIKEVKQRLKINLDSCSNLYTLFLLKSMYQLKPEGKGAFLLPSELMNADYGKEVKNWLIENNLLEYIIILDFQENFFDDALTTSCILLLHKDFQPKKVKFIPIKTQAELTKIAQQIQDNTLDLSRVKIYENSQIKGGDKWRIYYQDQSNLKYKNLVPFSDYARVMRGIATGDNNYFTFSQSKQLAYQIKAEYLLPCLTKASDVSLPFFDQQCLNKLINDNKIIFLLNVINLDDQAVKNYILMGENQGVNQKYLTSHRQPWYKIENRLPAPILVNVFNRKGLRFIRNLAQVCSLTTFHCVYLHPFILPRIDLLFAYLITSIAQEIFNDNRREYGEGLKKFEPNDLNNSLVVNLELIQQNQEQELVEILKLYHQSLLNNDTIISEKYWQELNQKFQQILGQ